MSELLAYINKSISDNINPELKSRLLSSEATSTPAIVNENGIKTKSTTTTIIAPPSSSSSSTTTSNALTQVTPNRKQTLLLEARRARVEWIDNAKSFFITTEATTNNNIDATRSDRRQKSKLISELNGLDSYMDVLSSCKAGMTLQSMPYIIKNVLYKDLSEDEIEERISRQLSSQISSADIKNIISSTPATKSTIDDTSIKTTTSATITSIDVDEKDSSILETTTEIQKSQIKYEALLRKLRSPEYAELIHTTKQFVESLEEKTTTTTLPSSSPSKNENDTIVSSSSVITIFLQNNNEEEDEDMITLQEHLELLSSSIQSFLKSTIKTYQSLLVSTNNNTVNKDNNDNNNIITEDKEHDNYKLFETFILNQSYQCIWNNVLQRSKKLLSYDNAFYNKLLLLKFLTPNHFEIPYFSTMSQEESDIRLQIPILYLQSITRVASPYYKLQCIYNAYKSILGILSTDYSTNSEEKDALMKSTPNADDVIPTFIYTLLRANPKGLITHLYAYEIFSQMKDNNLTGEIGYAFTNLIAAIQFLLQVNVRMAGDSSSHSINNDEAIENEHEDNVHSNYIHVSLEEHKQFILSLEEDKIKKLQKLKNNELTNETTATGEESCEKISGFKEDNALIENNKPTLSVHMVRQARLNKTDEPSQHPNIHTITTTTNTTSLLNKTTTTIPPTCNYTFLGKQLQDIRVQDVPLLLKEYHTILYAYEELVMEMKKKEIHDNKKNREMQRELLEHNFNAQSNKDIDD